MKDDMQLMQFVVKGSKLSAEVLAEHIEKDIIPCFRQVEMVHAEVPLVKRYVFMVGGFSVEDVIGYAEDRGQKLSEKQAKKVLLSVEKNFDADYGVSWMTIEIEIDNLLRGE
jgi:hypothetical protein